jgi:hypothetical protein
LNQPRGVGSLLLQVAGKLFGRIENGLNTDVDEPFLTERGLGADATDLLMQFLDNRLGRAGRGNESEVDRRQIGKAQLALYAEVHTALADPTLTQRIADTAGEPSHMARERIEPFVKAEIAKWAEVVKRAGIKVE